MSNLFQKEILDEFKKLDSGSTKFNLPKYLGTNNKIYHLKNAVEKQIAKDFIKRHPDISKDQFLDLLDALYVGESFNERCFGTKLIPHKKSFKVLFSPRRVFDWLTNLFGWSEVDSLCQSTFTAKDLLENWTEWESTIKKKWLLMETLQEGGQVLCF